MRTAFFSAMLATLTVVALAAVLIGLPGDNSRSGSEASSLPRIAPAPPFKLISQDRAAMALADYRGKVLAVTFILTLCTSTCPVLTPMMVTVQDRLGHDFGSKICVGRRLGRAPRIETGVAAENGPDPGSRRLGAHRSRVRTAPWADRSCHSLPHFF